MRYYKATRETPARLIHDSRVVARETRGPLTADDDQRGWNRFVAYVSFDGDTEEIDVDATSKQAAREFVQRHLNHEYQPGGKILKLRVMTGWYL